MAIMPAVTARSLFVESDKPVSCASTIAMFSIPHPNAAPGLDSGPLPRAYIMGMPPDFSHRKLPGGSSVRPFQSQTSQQGQCDLSFPVLSRHIREHHAARFFDSALKPSGEWHRRALRQSLFERPTTRKPNMAKDMHMKAAEHHDNAAKSHRSAADAHGANDDTKAHEHSTKAHGHSTDAHKASGEAHTKSSEKTKR
jgi:hypothetical protein